MLCAGLAAIATAGCSRPPQGESCPDAAEGDLVITEIRGAQRGGDNRGQWFEVYNATEEPMELRGLRIEFFDAQGARSLADRPIVVRAESLIVDADAYVTFGHHDPGSIPAFIDYSFIVDYFSDAAPEDDDQEDLGFGEDFVRRPRSLLKSGRIDISACGVLVDRLRYIDLPSEGSLSLDGDLDPSAQANDNAENLCVNADEEELEPGEPQLFIGLPGTPQVENPPCIK